MDASGRLDRRITISRATESRDASNNVVSTWSDLTTVWASRQDIRDSERIAAQEVGAEITTRFQIRWSSVVSGVTPKDRISFAGRVYDIVAVKETARRAWLEITASARAE